MDTAALKGLIEASDLQGLIRAIDEIVADGDWDGLVDMRDRCDEAVERGKQLWGVSQFAEYRLALDAPGSFAGRVVREGAGRNTLGPLWEVAASTHSWEQLEPHITGQRMRALAAHERAIRGDAVVASSIDDGIVDVSLGLAGWEPNYPVAEYRSDRAAFPERDMPDMEWISLPDAGALMNDNDAAEALLDLARVWIDESSGRGEARAVSGTALGAIRALGPRRVRIAEVTLTDAMAVMTWVGASGGAHGKRRGTPVGRAAAWWALASTLGIEIEWPVDPEELDREGNGLRWYVWDPGDRVGGWNYHLAVEDSMDGLAWAVSAVDWK